MSKENGSSKGTVDFYKKSAYRAFKRDAHEFLEQFAKENTLNYADFAGVWQQNNFTFIFANQDNKITLKILCEVIFLTLKKYIFSNASLNIKIGAFYLLYGLYYKQPIKGFVKVRLTIDEYKKLKEIMNEMMVQGQYDAVYIFSKMKSDDVFLYVAYPKPLSVCYTLTSRSTEKDLEFDDIFNSKSSERLIYNFEYLLKDESIQALGKTCEEYYTKLKKFSEHNPGLVPLKSTLMKDLLSTNKHKKALPDRSDTISSEEGEDRMEPDMTLHDTRQRIRLKAMGNKNAVYRGEKKVLTVIDFSSDEFSDSFSE